jgi:hypothetical protein
MIASVPEPGAIDRAPKDRSKNSAPAASDCERRTREVERIELGATRKSPHSLQINRCFDVVNTRHLPAFFKSAYKIYAVRLSKRYKSNIFSKAASAMPTSPRAGRSLRCGRFHQPEGRKARHRGYSAAARAPRSQPNSDISADTGRIRSTGFAGRAHRP